MIRRRSIFNSLRPDASGNVWWEPLTVAATADRWRHGVLRFKKTASRVRADGVFTVGSDYAGATAARFVAVWSSTGTSGNVVMTIPYRAVGGDNAESLDSTGEQEAVSITDAAPTAALNRLQVSGNATPGNFAAGDTVQFSFDRDGASASDTLSADLLLVDLLFEYEV